MSENVASDVGGRVADDALRQAIIEATLHPQTAPKAEAGAPVRTGARANKQSGQGNALNPVVATTAAESLGAAGDVVWRGSLDGEGLEKFTVGEINEESSKALLPSAEKPLRFIYLKNQDMILWGDSSQVTEKAKLETMLFLLRRGAGVTTRTGHTTYTAERRYRPVDPPGTQSLAGMLEETLRERTLVLEESNRESEALREKYVGKEINTDIMANLLKR